MRVAQNMDMTNANNAARKIFLYPEARWPNSVKKTAKVDRHRKIAASHALANVVPWSAVASGYGSNNQKPRI